MFDTSNVIMSDVRNEKSFDILLASLTSKSPLRILSSNLPNKYLGNRKGMRCEQTRTDPALIGSEYN
jgi:hypothetical protein